MITAVLPAGDGAIATEGQLDALLESVVARVVAGSGTLRADPPTEADEFVDTMVLLLCGGFVGLGASDSEPVCVAIAQLATHHQAAPARNSCMPGGISIGKR